MNDPRAQLLDLLATALSDGSFVKLTLSKPARGAPADGPRQVFARPVDLRAGPHLSLLFRHPSKDVTRNVPRADARDEVARLLTDTFGNAHLFTTGADVELRSNKKGEARLHRHAATFTDAPDARHDRQKRYVLDPAASPWLRELGIVSPEGHVKSDKADKYRQLQSLVKHVDELVDDAGLRGRPRLRVVDFGCGKAYLTFALYDYFNHHVGVPTEVVGVDRNATLMEACAGVAARLSYTGLSFTRSGVEDYDPGATDVIVALHACDTATDLALYRGVTSGAALVLAVPCCQKELRPQLRPPADELPLLRHDTFKDRYSQMLTDGLRALRMEGEGYRTRVFEFISDAHTHRNVMIAATRAEGPPEGARRDARRAEAAALKARYGIRSQALDALLDARPR
jgi:SAM-dependent methyltransferase